MVVGSVFPKLSRAKIGSFTAVSAPAGCQLSEQFWTVAPGPERSGRSAQRASKRKTPEHPNSSKKTEKSQAHAPTQIKVTFANATVRSILLGFLISYSHNGIPMRLAIPVAATAARFAPARAAIANLSVCRGQSGAFLLWGFRKCVWAQHDKAYRILCSLRPRWAD